MGDLLAVERDEAAVVWSAMAQNLPVEHRADINPVALLGVRLVTAPAVNPSPETSPQHVITSLGCGDDRSCAVAACLPAHFPGSTGCEEGSR
jgi:hypothetical protein